MAHANPVGGATVFFDDPAPSDGVPEDTFSPDGWPGVVRFTGPGDTYGSGVVIDIDADA